MGQRFLVRLSESERNGLRSRLRQALTERQRRRVRTLLLADEGQSDASIAKTLETSLASVRRTRKRFAQEGLDAARSERPRSGKPRTLDGKQEAMLVALACSQAPEGQVRWNARLLASKLVELEVVETVSDDTVRRVLKKTSSSRGRSGRGACPR